MGHSYKEYKDSKLVKLMKGGKPASDGAFAELYRRYSSMIHTYCNYMMGGNDQAEDIFQETFIRFYKKINEDFKDMNISGYLFKIARNLCYNYNRDRKYTLPIEGDELVTDEKSVYEKNEMMDLIKKAIELLDYKYKEAFIMREVEGLQYKDIAAILDISLSGAKTRVVRAKEKLIEILDPYLKGIY